MILDLRFLKLSAEPMLLQVCRAIFILCAVLTPSALDAIEVDGKLDEPEWQQAQVFNHFIQNWPDTGEAPRFNTKVLLITNKDGIFVGFVNQQPRDARSRRYSGHDQFTSADFDMVFIDFNGDGNTAYEFVATLGGGTMDGTYSRGNNSNRDWDGPWTVAVSEDDTNWYSEFFIPWSIATYKSQADIENTEHSGGGETKPDGQHPAGSQSRNISVFFQRFNVFESESYAFPDTSRGRANFTYEYHPIRVSFNESRSLAINGYIASTYQAEEGTTDTDAGIDLIWKPSTSQQFIATINPDFGQVESDELIVNFSAVETLRTDKRPFFTENQSLFDVRGPENLRLFNTRRIGGTSDGESNDIYDISGALKYISAFESIDLGLFFAQEKDLADAEGKTFMSARWLQSDGELNYGQLINYVDNPTQNRSAYTSNFDLNYTVSANTKVFANIIGSRIEQAVSNQGTMENISSSGFGATVSASYRPIRTWDNLLEISYFDDELELNDMGYLARNDILTARLTSKFNDYSFGKDSLFRRSYYYAKLTHSRNTEGEKHPWIFDGLNEWEFKSKHKWLVGFQHISDGIDDLISRGAGSVYLPSRDQFDIRYSSPTPADFSFKINGFYFQEGLDDWASKLTLTGTQYFSDSIRLDMSYNIIDSKDWLIGDSSGELRQYSRKFHQTKLKLIAQLSANADLTLISQWYALKAKGLNTYQVNSDASLTSTFSPPQDFTSTQSALQVRYRYRFAPLSEFYLVYARNGFFTENTTERGLGELFQQTFDDPDQDYLIAKIRYQF